MASTKRAIYYLCSAEGDILYIGKSVSALQRLFNHKNDKKWWDEVDFVFLETVPPEMELDVVERLRIRTLCPKYNMMRYGKQHLLDARLEQRDSSGELIYGNIRDLFGQWSDSADSFGQALLMVESLCAGEIVPEKIRSRQLFELLLLEREGLRREIAELKSQAVVRGWKDDQLFEEWLSHFGRIIQELQNIRTTIGKGLEEAIIQKQNIDTARSLNKILKDCRWALRELESLAAGFPEKVNHFNSKTPIAYGRRLWLKLVDKDGALSWLPDIWPYDGSRILRSEDFKGMRWETEDLP